MTADSGGITSPAEPTGISIRCRRNAIYSIGSIHDRFHVSLIDITQQLPAEQLSRLGRDKRRSNPPHGAIPKLWVEEQHISSILGARLRKQRRKETRIKKKKGEECKEQAKIQKCFTNQATESSNAPSNASFTWGIPKFGRAANPCTVPLEDGHKEVSNNSRIQRRDQPYPGIVPPSIRSQCSLSTSPPLDRAWPGITTGPLGLVQRWKGREQAKIFHTFRTSHKQRARRP